jgi:N-acetyl-gamma-glutamyl-phosphate reductase
MRTGVVGASGYAGGELLRILSTHPKFKVSYIAAGSNAGELISDFHPLLQGFNTKKFEDTSIEKINQCDLIFIALPHGESAKLVDQIDQRVKIVDLGADFRLSDPQQWKKYYGIAHAGSWPYGLPELVDHSEISSANRVANPGCYATAISLAIAPILDVIDSADILVVASSGTTGAGRNAKVNMVGSEFRNNLTSYKFGGVHQHTPEIEQVLNHLSKKQVKISFTPVLAPIPRGILATVSAKLSAPLTSATIRDSFVDFYSNSAFVKFLDEGLMPQTLSVLGSNNVEIQAALDEHVGRVVISVAIDNLGKGAAGQAIQNANLMTGQPESAGLTNIGFK